MRIGIVGPADRAVAWEEHLRPHRSVSEVVTAATLDRIGSVDACFLMDESDQRLNHLLQAIKAGLHTFFISPLPVDSQIAEKIYYSSEEANVQVQFSHWPTLAPASRWMAQQLKKPSFIQINRNISHTKFLEQNVSFRELWVDDLAFCLKYIGGAVHHFDVNTSVLQSGKPYAIHISLRFDSGATAIMFMSTCAENHSHRRYISDHSLILNCNVKTQTVRIGRENDQGHLFFKKKMFDSSLSAEKAVTQFLKSVQLKKPTLYNSFDLLKLTELVNRIETRI